MRLRTPLSTKSKSEMSMKAPSAMAKSDKIRPSGIDVPGMSISRISGPPNMTMSTLTIEKIPDAARLVHDERSHEHDARGDERLDDDAAPHALVKARDAARRRAVKHERD